MVRTPEGTPQTLTRPPWGAVGHLSAPKRAFRNLVDDVLGADSDGVVKHTLRHTAAIWLTQAAPTNGRLPAISA